VKFSELCDLLSPAMEERGIGVSFSGVNVPRQNEIRDNYPIVAAIYRANNPFPFREDCTWEIEVSPVPRAIRNQVREVLLPALPTHILPWLIAKRTSGWILTYHAIRVQFDTASKQLLFHEHNEI